MVEHVIGNDGVVSPILTSGTSFPRVSEFSEILIFFGATQVLHFYPLFFMKNRIVFEIITLFNHFKINTYDIPIVDTLSML